MKKKLDLSLIYKVSGDSSTIQWQGKICVSIYYLCLLLLLCLSLTIISASSSSVPGGEGWMRRGEAGCVTAGNGYLSSCLNTVSTVPGLERKICSCCFVFCLRLQTGGSGSCPGSLLWLFTIPADVPQPRCFFIFNLLWFAMHKFGLYLQLFPADCPSATSCKILCDLCDFFSIW